MLLRAVCSQSAMTASTQSCLTGRGVPPWVWESEEEGRGPPSLEEVSEGGWPLVFGGGVGKVW